jgi:adenylate cyclase
VGKKLPLGYKYLGEQKVKNIEKPIRAYKVLVEPEAAGKVIGERQRLKLWHWTAILALAVLIAVGGTLALWEFYVRPDVAPASIEKMAYPLPDKPSIAVLPFDNMSKDPDQEYFSDGLTEDIIAALSSIPDLFVIARNSTFTYKGKPVKVQQVSEELGVQYILEGSVRKSEDRIRVTAQLIDALSGKHVWAEKYDRELKDVFAVTDEITLKIVNQLQVKMIKREGMMPCWRGTNNIQAYLKYLQGWWYFVQNTIESNAMGRQLLQEALALDPEFSAAYTVLAYTHYIDVLLGSTKSPKESIAKAVELAQKSVAASPLCPAPYQTLSSCYLLMRRHDEAITECEKAISLGPNYSNAYMILATNLAYAGRAKDALTPIQAAFRIDPKPHIFLFCVLGFVYYNNGMYEEAVSTLKKGLEVAPNSLRVHIRLAASYSALGKEKEAREEIAELLRLNPKLTLAYLSKAEPYKNQSDLDTVLNDLRKAGLPE